MICSSCLKLPEVCSVQVAPNNRQAQQLKELVDEKVMREGMIGLGIIGAGAAAAAVIAAAVIGRR